jgi:hypothetical protein
MILVKFLLTIVATIILLQHMQAVSNMSRIATETTLSSADFHAQRIQHVVHAAGGLLVVLAAAMLSIFKPWGMTPYGRRRLSQTDLPALPNNDVPLLREPPFTTGRVEFRINEEVHAGCKTAWSGWRAT